MALYGAIDLHSNNHVIVVINEDDQRLVETRCDNNLLLTLRTLEPFRDELECVAVESTYNWYWLIDGLEDHGYRPQLVNVLKVRQYEGLKHTDDNYDAWWLAHLARIGSLPVVNYLPRDQRRLRDVMRKRVKLVQHATAHWLMLGRQLAAETGWSGKIRKVAQDVSWDDPALALNWDASDRVIGALDGEIHRIERWLRDRLADRADYEVLRTIGGVGLVLAATIVLETGHIQRFRSAGAYASYSRLVNASRWSNDKKKGNNNRKAGNPYLSWAFHEAAHQARIHQPQARRFFQRKAAKTNGIVAIRALATKLAKASYYMLRDQVPYDPQRLFH